MQQQILQTLCALVCQGGSAIMTGSHNSGSPPGRISSLFANFLFLVSVFAWKLTVCSTFLSFLKFPRLPRLLFLHEFPTFAPPSCPPLFQHTQSGFRGLPFLHEFPRFAHHFLDPDWILESGILESWILESWILGSWNPGSWNPGSWDPGVLGPRAPPGFYPFLLISLFFCPFLHEFQVFAHFPEVSLDPTLIIH